ncbi:hypothetical protein EVAR_62116_1 [Eumeta japonica]|uniref:Uncharacterized protein n=1 Tax=Eumeta variegata TaxID=151549 RepID=A0A4C1Z292_EUMVA|nr:hypothetical protein EVAR_62116_1 [Eumeta japonica]
MIEPDEPMSDIELYPTKNRPPTPYPTMTEAAELAFLDRSDDIPSPTAIGTSPLPEKEKMLEDLVRASNLMKRFIIESMLKGIHLGTWKITMPPIRQTMEWGEAVESLARLLMNSQIEPHNTGLRRVADFLTRRVMHFLQVYIKEDRWMKKNPQPEPKVEEEQAPESQERRHKLSKKKK